MFKVDKVIYLPLSKLVEQYKDLPDDKVIRVRSSENFNPRNPVSKVSIGILIVEKAPR